MNYREKTRKTLSLMLCFTLAGLQGCATIMSGTTGSANIRTTPSEAKYTIYRNGEAIHSGVSPQVVQLKKRGKYSIRIEMEGYDPIETRIKKGVSGWYVLGNLVFGGLVGWIIVDPLSGAMFTFPEKNTSFVLTRKRAGLSSEAVGEGIVILSMNEIPQDLRQELVLIPTHKPRLTAGE